MIVKANCQRAAMTASVTCGLSVGLAESIRTRRDPRLCADRGVSAPTHGPHQHRVSTRSRTPTVTAGCVCG